MHKRYMNVMFFLLQMLQMHKQHTPPYVFADQAAAIKHQDENMLQKHWAVKFIIFNERTWDSNVSSCKKLSIVYHVNLIKYTWLSTNVKII